VGAATANDAVAAMMAAVKAGDLQAFGTVWGTSQGSVREQWDRSEYEMRAYYAMKCLRNDSYSIVGNEARLNGGRVLVVELRKGPIVATSKFDMTVGPGGKWFVEKFDPIPLTRICQAA
jgi:galactokinase